MSASTFLRSVHATLTMWSVPPRQNDAIAGRRYVSLTIAPVSTRDCGLVQFAGSPAEACVYRMLLRCEGVESSLQYATWNERARGSTAIIAFPSWSAVAA